VTARGGTPTGAAVAPALAPEAGWAWLRRWDHQQRSYLPRREERFDAMLDVVADLLGPDPVAVDLACGPGSLAARLLDRLPGARCVAVDVDPVLLGLGRSALGDRGGRLRFVEADLRAPGWTAALGVDGVDAVLSTTALHWLAADALVRLYGDLAGLLRPGGLFVNGDHLSYGPAQPTLRRAAAAAAARRGERARAAGDERWDAWWDAAAADPALAPLVARRRALDHEADHGDSATTLDLHRAALAEAGFRESGVVWQDLDDRVLLAVR